MSEQDDIDIAFEASVVKATVPIPGDDRGIVKRIYDDQLHLRARLRRAEADCAALLAAAKRALPHIGPPGIALELSVVIARVGAAGKTR